MFLRNETSRRITGGPETRRITGGPETHLGTIVAPEICLCLSESHLAGYSLKNSRIASCSSISGSCLLLFFLVPCSPVIYQVGSNGRRIALSVGDVGFLPLCRACAVIHFHYALMFLSFQSISTFAKDFTSAMLFGGTNFFRFSHSHS